MVDIQKQITESTGIDLGTIQGDALQKRDYSVYCLEKPAFLISLVGGVRERVFDCLKSSLKEYTPNLLEESLFVTIHYEDNNSSKGPIFDSENLLNEICRLQLPTYWDKEANYRISKLKL